MRTCLSAAIFLGLAACGGSSTSGTNGSTSSQIAVDPAALYCQGTGGQFIERISRGRRSDLCRLPNGRTVRTADLINSHNNL
ncbi:MAG: DUF333 domain-containing protein [Paracoccus sp. (in: a-proteobacteria)]